MFSLCSRCCCKVLRGSVLHGLSFTRTTVAKRQLTVKRLYVNVWFMSTAISKSAAALSKAGWKKLNREQRAARARHAVRCYWDRLTAEQKSSRNIAAAQARKAGKAATAYLTTEQLQDARAKRAAQNRSKPSTSAP